MALTQSQMTAEVADRAELSKPDAKRVLGALDQIILEELGNRACGRSRTAPQSHLAPRRPSR